MPAAHSSAVDAQILQDVLAGDFRTIARLITLVENRSPEAIAYLRQLFPHTGQSLAIGITGSPGSGKSTLVDQLATHYRQNDQKLGILAVDPSSPFSGGAILGDLIRMKSRSVDPGTFIRSMATRGHLGGLASATADVLLILDAAGFERVLIETVGVGQDEVDIIKTAHVTLVLLVPGMGDDIQAMKAGIMEIGDIFVLNKADHPGVERVEAEVMALLSISSRPDGWKPLVVRTIASDGQGIDECAKAIEAYREFRQTSQFQKDRSRQVQRERLLELVRSRLLRDILHERGAPEKLEELTQRVLDRQIDPYSAADELLLESATHKPKTENTGSA
jgi:LAO/AO transport system kinase